MEQPFEPSLLPLSFDVETKKVLRKVTEAHKHLAELNGTVRTIPNESILINTLVLQEVKDQTARTYLEKLNQAGIVEKVQLGKSNFYVNQHLFRLFTEAKNRT